jgi:hypothetical protein
MHYSFRKSRCLLVNDSIKLPVWLFNKDIVSNLLIITAIPRPRDKKAAAVSALYSLFPQASVLANTVAGSKH